MSDIVDRLRETARRRAAFEAGDVPWASNMSSDDLDVAATEIERLRFCWLIEAPGQKYLAARALPATYYEFVWTGDANTALCFRDREQARLTMMAIRRLLPELFAFEQTLGDANPVEHGWLAGHQQRQADK